LHPWLSGQPSRVRLIERLVRSIQEKERVWFSRGQGIASYFRANPDARREVDFDYRADKKDSFRSCNLK